MGRFKAARKIDANSLYTGIDLILKKYGINRAEYHGGDLTGVHVKKLMESANEITNDIRDYLIGSLHPESNETEDSIKETCSNGYRADLKKGEPVWSVTHATRDSRFPVPCVVNCTPSQHNRAPHSAARRSLTVGGVHDSQLLWPSGP